MFVLHYVVVWWLVSAISGTAAHQASLSFTVSQSLLKFMSMYPIVKGCKEVIKAVYLGAC